VFPGGVVAHNSGVVARNSGVIARYSGVILRGYLFCILLFQHTSVDPDFFDFPGVFAEFRLFDKFPAYIQQILASGKHHCRKSV
jgi:hypothetical protein